MKARFSITNLLIIISIIFTFISFQNQEILNFWLNDYFLSQNDYLRFFIQICFYSFLHWWIMHLVFNSLFIYIFWNQVEEIIWWKLFLIFFILTTLFNTIFILLFSSWNTIWISGFCMALLSFYTLKLYEVKNTEYKWWITAIIVNILIWFSGSISLVWHLFWAIFGGIYYLILKILKSPN